MDRTRLIESEGVATAVVIRTHELDAIGQIGENNW